jgi:hypothetical protein
MLNQFYRILPGTG